MACSPCEAAARARARERLKKQSAAALPWLLVGGAVALYLLAKGTGQAVGTAVGGATPSGGG